ncbi:MAG: pilus assembly protein PilM [Planctomycetes bacterium]|nr:pilus assembly protein PilM [Planctomycetota bacterium]
MASKTITIIDVGSSVVKVVSLRMRKARFEVIGAGMAQLTEHEKKSDDFNTAVAAVINRIIKRNGIPMGYTLISLPGRGTMMRYLSVPMVPPWKLGLLMGFEVEEQIGATGGSEVAYDYRILNLPEFSEGLFPMFLTLAQIPVINNRIEICRQGAGHFDDVGLQALGAYNAFRLSPQWKEEEFSVLLDIGAEETHLTIQNGDNLLYARTISFGGRQFTQRIQTALALLDPEAEEYKLTEANINPADDELHNESELEVAKACRSEVRNLVSQIHGSVRYFKNQFHVGEFQFTKVFITGGGSRLKGFAEALSESVKCEVEYLDLHNIVDLKGKSAEAALLGDGSNHFTGTIGLGLGRLVNGFNVSLLPPEVKKQREFWRSKVYTYYSAVVALMLLILVGVGGCPWYGGGNREANYETERRDKWEQHLKAAEEEHKQTDKLKQLNVKLAEQVASLEARHRSGINMLKALELLRNKTPSYVVYTAMSTAEIPDEEIAKEEGEEKKVKVVAERSLRDVGTFQTNSFLELKGYLFGRSSPKEARDDLIKIKNDILGSDSKIFTEVTIRRTEILEEDSLEYAGAFEILNDTGEVEAKVNKRRGVPLAFVMRCMINKDG